MPLADKAIKHTFKKSYFRCQIQMMYHNATTLKHHFTEQD